MAFGYGSASGVPASDAFYLTPEYWNKTAYKASYHDFVFKDLIGPEKSGNMIVYKADDLNKGGKASTVAMRLNVDRNVKPVKGGAQLINYQTIDSSATEDMSWAKMQVYAGRERYGWSLKSVEDERMVRYLGVINESAQFVGELFRQRDEEEIIHAMIFGLSRSVTRVPGRNDYGGTATKGHMQKMPASFKRVFADGSHGITHMPHPNTYFLDEAQIPELVTASVTTPADIKFDTVLTAMAAVSGSTNCYFSLAAIARANRQARKNKLKQINIPGVGPRWLWFIPPAAASDLRILLASVNQAAGPREYGTNRLWSGVLGDYMGFLFVESEYLLPFNTIVADDTLTTTLKGYQWITSTDEVGTMELGVTDASLLIHPTLICGQEVLAYTQPESMTNAEEWLDGRNKYVKIGARTFGYRRGDWFKDNTVDYFSGGSTATSLVSAYSGYGTPVVWNWSSMLVFCRAVEPKM